MERTAISATSSALRIALGALFLFAGCEGDTITTEVDEPVIPTPTDYSEDEDAPTLTTAIVDLLGAGNSDGSFAPGDELTVQFTLKKEDDTSWMLGELVSGHALVSGPTYNYQRVIALRTDVLDEAEPDGGELFRYSLGELPGVYAAPYNASESFGEGDGEMAGQELAPGTYTVGLSFTWEYQVGDVTHARVGEATFDFSVGEGAGPLLPREVTSQANCNACHVDLSAHEGRYHDVKLCMLCHTSGAEDLNDPGILGGTPGVSIDSRVLFHKIHNGRNLPSVNGVSVNPSGERIYEADLVPLRYVGDDGAVRDFSHVGFPVLPQREIPMPRDTGFDDLPADARLLEDIVRSGPTECSACHGDPDGDGPAHAPAQGELVFAQPSRRACGSCHDDVKFDQNYQSNNQFMPPQADDTQCTFCHQVQFPDALNPMVAHVHPLRDPARNPGLNWEVISMSESGANDGDGTFDPGEKISVSLTLENDQGLPVNASSLDFVRLLVTGPTTNPQLLQHVELPGFALPGAQPYTFDIPSFQSLEFVGNSTGAASEQFTTRLAPHRAALGVPTLVQVRASIGNASVLTQPAVRHQNYLDVASGALFARDDVVCIDDGSPEEEVRRVQLVDGNRLWLSSPGQPAYPVALRSGHPAGTSIEVIELAALTEGVDYTLDPVLGQIDELVEFGAGAEVVVTYLSDFVVPDDYGPSINASPDLGAEVAEWTGLPIVDGTYTFQVQAVASFEFSFLGQVTPYERGSTGGTRTFELGDATVPMPYDLISSADNCERCHKQLTYHNGRDRGFSACIACHGTSGSEDRPRYVAANAPETPGVSIQFRSLLHKIHRGRNLEDKGFQVAGAGDAGYPDNVTVHAYDTFGFPVQPSGTKDCGVCHGDVDEAVFFPRDRDHPLGQTPTALEWTFSCGACHDSSAALAHMASNTAPSGEACAICHGPGEDEDVLRAHKVRRSF